MGVRFGTASLISLFPPAQAHMAKCSVGISDRKRPFVRLLRSCALLLIVSIFGLFNRKSKVPPPCCRGNGCSLREADSQNKTISSGTVPETGKTEVGSDEKHTEVVERIGAGGGI